MLKEIQKYVAISFAKSLAFKKLNDPNKFTFYGYSEDSLENVGNYEDQFNPTSHPEIKDIKRIAQLINTGQLDQVDAKDLAKIMTMDDERLVKLVKLLTVRDRESNDQISLFLRRLNYLMEIDAAQAEKEMNQVYSGSGSSLGNIRDLISKAGGDDQDREERIATGKNVAEGHDQMEDAEKYVVAPSNTQEKRFLDIANLVVRLLEKDFGIDEVRLVEGTSFAGAFNFDERDPLDGILPKKRIMYLNTSLVDEIGSSAYGGAIIDHGIDTIIHELAHALEHQLDGVGSESFMSDLGTHQPIGRFADAMKYLSGRMLTEYDQWLRDGGQSFEEAYEAADQRAVLSTAIVQLIRNVSTQRIRKLPRDLARVLEEGADYAEENLDQIFSSLRRFIDNNSNKIDDGLQTRFDELTEQGRLKSLISTTDVDGCSNCLAILRMVETSTNLAEAHEENGDTQQALKTLGMVSTYLDNYEYENDFAQDGMIAEVEEAEALIARNEIEKQQAIKAIKTALKTTERLIANRQEPLLTVGYTSFYSPKLEKIQFFFRWFGKGVDKQEEAAVAELAELRGYRNSLELRLRGLESLEVTRSTAIEKTSAYFSKLYKNGLKLVRTLIPRMRITNEERVRSHPLSMEISEYFENNPEGDLGDIYFKVKQRVDINEIRAPYAQQDGFNTHRIVLRALLDELNETGLSEKYGVSFATNNFDLISTENISPEVAYYLQLLVLDISTELEIDDVFVNKDGEISYQGLIEETANRLGEVQETEEETIAWIEQQLTDSVNNFFVGIDKIARFGLTPRPRKISPAQEIYIKKVAEKMYEVVIATPIDKPDLVSIMGIQQHQTAPDEVKLIYDNEQASTPVIAAWAGDPHLALQKTLAISKLVLPEGEVNPEFITYTLPTNGRSDFILPDEPLVISQVAFPVIQRKGVGNIRSALGKQKTYSQAIYANTDEASRQVDQLLHGSLSYPSLGFTGKTAWNEDINVTEQWQKLGMRVRLPLSAYELQAVYADPRYQLESIEEIKARGVDTYGEPVISTWGTRNPYTFADITKSIQQNFETKEYVPEKLKTYLDEMLSSQAYFLQFDNEEAQAIATKIDRNDPEAANDWLIWLAKTFGQQSGVKSQHGLYHAELHRQNITLGGEYRDLADLEHAVWGDYQGLTSDQKDELAKEISKTLFPIIEVQLAFNIANEVSWDTNIPQIVDGFFSSMKSVSPQVTKDIRRRVVQTLDSPDVIDKNDLYYFTNLFVMKPGGSLFESPLSQQSFQTYVNSLVRITGFPWLNKIGSFQEFIKRDTFKRSYPKERLSDSRRIARQVLRREGQDVFVQAVRKDLEEILSYGLMSADRIAFHAIGGVLEEIDLSNWDKDDILTIDIHRINREIYRQINANYVVFEFMTNESREEISFDDLCSSCSEVRDQTKAGIEVVNQLLSEGKTLAALDELDKTRREVVNTHGMQNQCVQLYLNAWVDTTEAIIRKDRPSINKAISSVFRATEIAEDLISRGNMDLINNRGFLGIGSKTDNINLTVADIQDINSMLEGNDEILGLKQMADFKRNNDGNLFNKRRTASGKLHDLKGVVVTGFLFDIEEQLRVWGQNIDTAWRQRRADRKQKEEETVTPSPSPSLAPSPTPSPSPSPVTQQEPEERKDLSDYYDELRLWSRRFLFRNRALVNRVNSTTKWTTGIITWIFGTDRLGLRPALWLREWRLGRDYREFPGLDEDLIAEAYTDIGCDGKRVIQTNALAKTTIYTKTCANGCYQGACKVTKGSSCTGEETGFFVNKWSKNLVTCVDGSWQGSKASSANVFAYSNLQKWQTYQDLALLPDHVFEGLNLNINSFWLYDLDPEVEYDENGYEVIVSGNADHTYRSANWINLSSAHNTGVTIHEFFHQWASAKINPYQSWIPFVDLANLKYLIDNPDIQFVPADFISMTGCKPNSGGGYSFSSQPVTDYGATNCSEDFAETGEMYVVDPCQLKRKDADRYDYFKDKVLEGVEYIPASGCN